MPNMPDGRYDMTYMWWQPGMDRRGRTFPPLRPTDGGWGADCIFCPRKLGGLGVQGLWLQEFAIGPAWGDEDAERAQKAGRWFNCAAIITHAEDLTRLADPEMVVARLIAGGLVMHANDIPDEPAQVAS